MAEPSNDNKMDQDPDPPSNFTQFQTIKPTQTISIRQTFEASINSKAFFRSPALLVSYWPNNTITVSDSGASLYAYLSKPAVRKIAPFMKLSVASVAFDTKYCIVPGRKCELVAVICDLRSGALLDAKVHAKPKQPKNLLRVCVEKDDRSSHLYPNDKMEYYVEQNDGKNVIFFGDGTDSQAFETVCAPLKRIPTLTMIETLGLDPDEFTKEELADPVVLNGLHDAYNQYLNRKILADKTNVSSSKKAGKTRRVKSILRKIKRAKDDKVHTINTSASRHAQQMLEREIIEESNENAHTPKISKKLRHLSLKGGYYEETGLVLSFTSVTTKGEYNSDEDMNESKDENGKDAFDSDGFMLGALDALNTKAGNKAEVSGAYKPFYPYRFGAELSDGFREFGPVDDIVRQKSCHRIGHQPSGSPAILSIISIPLKPYMRALGSASNIFLEWLGASPTAFYTEHKSYRTCEIIDGNTLSETTSIATAKESITEPRGSAQYFSYAIEQFPFDKFGPDNVHMLQLNIQNRPIYTDCHYEMLAFMHTLNKANHGAGTTLILLTPNEKTSMGNRVLYPFQFPINNFDLTEPITIFSKGFSHLALNSESYGDCREGANISTKTCQDTVFEISRAAPMIFSMTCENFSSDSNTLWIKGGGQVSKGSRMGIYGTAVSLDEQRFRQGMHLSTVKTYNNNMAKAGNGNNNNRSFGNNNNRSFGNNNNGNNSNSAMRNWLNRANK